jgi:hypothetical protein
MNQYIITEDGFADLDKYFLENKDDLIRIAWKNLKDKHIRPYQSERDKVLDELEKETIDWLDRVSKYGTDPERTIVLSFLSSIRKLRRAGE